MKRKSIIRNITGLNLALAVVLVVLLSTASIPISVGQEPPDVVFSWAVSNDDPSGGTSDDPMEVGKWDFDTRTWDGARYGKDVASTSCGVGDGSKVMSIKVGNGYPGYCGNVAFSIYAGIGAVNVTSIKLVNIQGSDLASPVDLVRGTTVYVDAETHGSDTNADTDNDGTDDADLSLTLSELGTGSITRPIRGGLCVRVEQPAAENAGKGEGYPAAYTFSVSINFEGSEESPSPPGPGPGPGPGPAPSPPPGTEIRGPVCTWRIEQLTVYPDEVYADEPVTVGVLITNPCDEAQECEVILKIDGVVEASKRVVVKPHETKQVLFTTSKHSAGTYTVEVNEYYAGTLVVKELVFPAPPLPTPKPINWWLILAIALAAAAIASLITYLVYRRKKRGEEEQS